MTQHIKEAIELNKNRMPIYAELTNGESLRFSRKLIAIEYLSLLVAKYIDRRAAFFNHHLVKIVAADFVSMKNTPSFESIFGEEINFIKSFEEFDFKNIEKLLSKGINENEFDGVQTLCDGVISKIAKHPHHYGMSRHLFESMRRIAYLAPLHAKECQQRSIKSSIPLSKILLRLHLIILQQAYLFDKEVAFIQNKGVPFIIQDMPFIELENPY